MIRSDKDGPAESPALSPAAGSILKPAGGGIPSASLKPLKAIALHTYVACSLKVLGAVRGLVKSRASMARGPFC